MPYFDHDLVRFHYRDAGHGLPFIFQHGLGGDLNQPFDHFEPVDGCRLLSFDCRSHGLTEPLAGDRQLSIRQYADDLKALMDSLQVDRAVVGGISMGAAVSLNFATRFPLRVLGIVQVRPAWFVGPYLDNSMRYVLIAALLRRYGPSKGKELFKQTSLYQAVAADSFDSANSLLGQFDAPHAPERTDRLEQIGLDAPLENQEPLRALRVPTLVLANHQDPVHPFALGQQIAQVAENAEFLEITPKSVSVELHRGEVRKYVGQFLSKHFLKS